MLFSPERTYFQLQQVAPGMERSNCVWRTLMMELREIKISFHIYLLPFDLGESLGEKKTVWCSRALQVQVAMSGRSNSAIRLESCILETMILDFWSFAKQTIFIHIYVTCWTLSTTQDKHLMRDKYSATFFILKDAQVAIDVDNCVPDFENLSRIREKGTRVACSWRLKCSHAAPASLLWHNLFLWVDFIFMGGF